jgi:hypothetical protein
MTAVATLQPAPYVLVNRVYAVKQPRVRYR